LPVILHQLFNAGYTDTNDIVTLRFCIAVPILWGVVFLRRNNRPADAKPLPWVKLLGLGFLYTAAALVGFYGLSQIPASIYELLYYAYPAMVAVIGLFLGERLGGQAWTALTLTIVGIVLTTPNLSAGGASAQANTNGVIAALVNAAIIAVYFICSDRILRGHSDMFHATAWTLTGTLLPLLVMIPFRHVSLPPSPTAWFFMVVLAIFNTVLPIGTVNAGIQLLGPSRAAILAMLEPPLAIVFASIFLGDRITPPQIVGGALILGSLILLNLRRSLKQTVEPELPLGGDQAAVS
jgi:drug/metabolite transporter (DMT)-like permease